MSQDCSRSKFHGVRQKLLRLRRDYFCIRSSERRSDCAASSGTRAGDDDDSPRELSLPPACGRTTGYRRSYEGGRPARNDDGRSSSTAEDSRLARRHSVPSRCVAVLESLDEEDLEAAAASHDCRPGRADEAYETADPTGSCFDGSSSTEDDHEDYQAPSQV